MSYTQSCKGECRCNWIMKWVLFSNEFLLIITYLRRPFKIFGKIFNHQRNPLLYQHNIWNGQRPIRWCEGLWMKMSMFVFWAGSLFCIPEQDNLYSSSASLHPGVMSLKKVSVNYQGNLIKFWGKLAWTSIPSRGWGNTLIFLCCRNRGEL